MRNTHKHRDEYYETGSTMEDRFYKPGDPRLFKEHLAFEDIHYLPHRQAIYDALLHSDYSLEESTNPPSRWLNDIHAYVADILQLQDYSDLHVFPALGTSADIHHGVDGIVMLRDPVTHKKYTVTFDLTAKPYKDTIKADLLITPDGAILPDGTEYIVPDQHDTTKAEEQEIRKQRKCKIALAIAHLLLEHRQHAESLTPLSSKEKANVDSRGELYGNSANKKQQQHA